MILTIPAWFEITGTILSVLINGAMFAVAIISAWYAYRAYSHQKDRSKKAAACDLAKYYASSIIDKYADIVQVYGAAGITDLVKSVFSFRELQEFDKEELLTLLKKSGTSFDDFQKKITRIDPGHILSTKLYRTCSVEERGKTYNGYTEQDETGKVQVINGSFLQADFDQEISGLLNELEWFAMNCRYGLADEELLYQSLHQTFLSTVWMLYFYISSRNENNEDKLYTNVIWLFTEWRDRLVAITDRKYAEQQEYLTKAKSVKAKVYEGTKLR